AGISRSRGMGERSCHRINPSARRASSRRDRVHVHLACAGRISIGIVVSSRRVGIVGTCSLTSAFPRVCVGTILSRLPASGLFIPQLPFPLPLPLLRRDRDRVRRGDAVITRRARPASASASGRVFPPEVLAEIISTYQRPYDLRIQALYGPPDSRAPAALIEFKMQPHS
ncbi:hypothetical protein B0H14DRAFT_2760127, partial [Mycena olivaceomarginata]